MSEQVKRYNAKLASFGGQFRVVVLASDYDALAQRCRELEEQRSRWANNAVELGSMCDTLRAEVIRVAVESGDAAARETRLIVEARELRAEVERLRNSLERIHLRAEAFVSGGSGMGAESVEVIAGITRKALEAGP